jgi:P-type E1-E2 ATPase
VKSNVKGTITLSVGDGANDVNMIKQAHIGIGIFGKEGHQAASFSDYAVPNFKSLRRLMFWHGRSFGFKYSNFMKWFNYKS